jgi:hypothetical protein
MNKGILIGGAVVIGVILLVAGDILTVTTKGCSLPFDFVIGGTCMFGSLGMTIGATLLLAIALCVLSLIGMLIKRLFR